MSTTTTNPGLIELQEAILRLQAGVRDSQESKVAIETLEREREELRRKIGTVDAAVELIRESRQP